jgi:hypothetical protein
LDYLEGGTSVLNPTTYAAIQDLCIARTDRGDLFTSFDLHSDARRRGITEPLRYVSEAVDDFFLSGAMGPDYARTLIDFPGADVSAWLYHPWDEDINVYRPPDSSCLKETLPYQSQRQTVRDRPRRRAETASAMCPACARGGLTRLLVSRVLRWF